MEASPETPSPAIREEAHPFDEVKIAYTFVIACMVFVAWNEWPTDARKLEWRAEAYVAAAASTDAASVGRFFARSGAGTFQTQPAWAADPLRLAGSEVVGVAVDPDGRTATVTLQEKGSRVTWQLGWTKRDGTWYPAAGKK